MIDRYDITETMGIVGLLLLASGSLAILAVDFGLKSVPDIFLLLCIPTAGFLLMILAGLMEHYWNRKVEKK